LAITCVGRRNILTCTQTYTLHPQPEASCQSMEPALSGQGFSGRFSPTTCCSSATLRGQACSLFRPLQVSEAHSQRATFGFVGMWCRHCCLSAFESRATVGVRPDASSTAGGKRGGHEALPRCEHCCQALPARSQLHGASTSSEMCGGTWPPPHAAQAPSEALAVGREWATGLSRRISSCTSGPCGHEPSPAWVEQTAHSPPRPGPRMASAAELGPARARCSRHARQLHRPPAPCDSVGCT